VLELARAADAGDRDEDPILLNHEIVIGLAQAVDARDPGDLMSDHRTHCFSLRVWVMVLPEGLTLRTQRSI
jgi:hypothetical protein